MKARKRCRTRELYRGRDHWARRKQWRKVVATKWSLGDDGNSGVVLKKRLRRKIMTRYFLSLDRVQLSNWRESSVLGSRRCPRTLLQDSELYPRTMWCRTQDVATFFVTCFVLITVILSYLQCTFDNMERQVTCCIWTLQVDNSFPPPVLLRGLVLRPQIVPYVIVLMISLLPLAVDCNVTKLRLTPTVTVVTNQWWGHVYCVYVETVLELRISCAFSREVTRCGCVNFRAQSRTN